MMLMPFVSPHFPAGGSSFSPADLFASGEDGVWLPGDINYLFKNDAGTVPVTTGGDRVYHWSDKSGNNLDFIGDEASATSDIPTYAVDGNGNAVVSFDGTRDRVYQNSMPAVAPPFSVYFITSNITGGRNNTLFCRNDSTSGGYQLRINSSNNVQVLNQGITSLLASGGAVPSISSLHLIGIEHASDDTLTIYVDGYSDGAASVTPPSAFTSYRIGRKGSSADQGLHGYIHEAMYVNRTLTAEERAGLWAYAQGLA